MYLAVLYIFISKVSTTTWPAKIRIIREEQYLTVPVGFSAAVQELTENVLALG